jgi:hypothetical protein
VEHHFAYCHYHDNSHRFLGSFFIGVGQYRKRVERLMARSIASGSIVLLAVQGVSVGIMVLVAGISDNVANVMLILILGFWLIALIAHTGVLTGLLSSYQALATNPLNG